MLKIWLIDDDQDDQEIFKLALGSLNLKTDFYSATDGEQALKQIEEKQVATPDYIFLDLNMPKMNGVAFLSAIRQQNIFNEVPVFIYTTSSIGADINTCLNLGGKIMTKHSSFKDLCADLARIIQ